MENAINTVFEVSIGYVVPRCLHAIADLGVADAPCSGFHLDNVIGVGLGMSILEASVV